MASWQPQESGLVQLCNLFAISQRGENQAQILNQLEQYKQYPDFNNYLAYIFATAHQVPLEVRQSAGLYLKNSLKNYTATDAHLLEYLKNALVPMLAHPERPLRHTAGSCITTLVVSIGMVAWPQLVNTLQQCLSSSDAAALDGGLDGVYKIVEESPIQMEVAVPSGDASGGSTTISHLLVPHLLKLMQSGSGPTRRQAVAVLNLMAKDMSGGIAGNLDTYLHGLFALAHDNQNAVRQEVVKGMVQLVTIQPDRLQQYMLQVIEYMIQCNSSDDEGVALESCWFWIAFCDTRLDLELLKPFLSRVVPLLLKNMVFEEDDEEVQDAQEAEAGGDERANDMKPKHYKSNSSKAGEEVSFDDDDDDDDEPPARWNLRRCSAAALDRLAVEYGDHLLPIVMPIVEQRLQEADWRARESAILALGAISEGCHLGLLPYLSSLIDMLLPKLTDAQPMVRIISCWVLGRYSYWLLAGAQEAAAQSQAGGQAPGGNNLHVQLGHMVHGLLNCVGDRNRFVQDAACSALASLSQTAGSEDSGHMLLPYLREMVQVLCTAVKQYHKRNLNLACDALCMLGEAMGPQMRDTALLTIILPTLLQRIATFQTHERDLLPLVECLIMCANTCGSMLDSWVASMYSTAMSMAATQTSLKVGQPVKSASGKGVVEYDSDLHSVALDLVSALTEALGASMEPLVAGSHLVHMIVAACQDKNPDLRQAGFGLVGDLARSCISHLIPRVPELATAAIEALAPPIIRQDTLRSCNNACWSLGEVAIRLQPDLLAPWAASAAERMAGLLAAGNASLPHSLTVNAAITLGRIAWRAPDLLAPHLPHFCVPWCQALKGVRDDVEKEHAFHGLIALLARHPDPVLTPGPAFNAWAAAAVSWRDLRNPELKQGLRQMVQGFQSRMAAAGTWSAAVAGLEPPVAQKLAALGQA